jgi:hypothetical protein
MKPEQALWQLIKPYVPGHRERVENAAMVGGPDVNYCFNGKETWIELKVAKTENQDVLDLLRPEQKIWHLKRVIQGGKVFVLIRYRNKLVLLRAMNGGKSVCNYTTSIVLEMPWRWETFQAILKGETT